jgi:hypothetical protein
VGIRADARRPGGCALIAYEHVAVGFSMVLSLGVVRLLEGLRPALVPGRRYWVHALWVFQKLLNQAFNWWIFGTLREGIDWNVVSFLWVLLIPALLFLQATALVTSDPSAVASWRNHFFEIRRWFFSVDVVLLTHSVVTSSLYRDVPLLHPFRLLQGAGLTISVLGATSASSRLHAVLAPLAIVLQSVGLGSLFFRPEGLVV